MSIYTSVIRLIATGALLLVMQGCVTTGQSTNPVGSATDIAARREKFSEVYGQCLREKTPQLDDGISPADVIGDAVAHACRKEYMDLGMTFVDGDNQIVQDKFRQRLMYNGGERATVYVLSRRNALKKK